MSEHGDDVSPSESPAATASLAAACAGAAAAAAIVAGGAAARRRRDRGRHAHRRRGRRHHDRDDEQRCILAGAAGARHATDDAGAAAERSRRDTPADEPVERAVRVGGAIKAPLKIRNVQPIYPPIAQSARVQGVVIIEATIDRRGKVTGSRVLRSVPLLDQAALDAVRQWEYEPTLVNGVAVPVIVTVTVNFTLH